jgi:hypothetical protein
MATFERSIPSTPGERMGEAAEDARSAALLIARPG